MALIGALCAPTFAQVSPWTTHDHTTTPATSPYSNAVLNEAWADTKSPGDDFTYSVGTIQVWDTRIQSPSQRPKFSGVDVDLPPVALGILLNEFQAPVASPRQVVILQCVDSAGSIQWQRYFFGGTPTLEEPWLRGTNARGISVWAGDTAEDTRIAICGETYDDELPLSQEDTGWTQPTLTALPNATGFIAVYDGTGTLLWTHHFFGQASSSSPEDPDCAITDISIRTELVEETLRDIVTYCGISSYGNPGTLTAWMEPILRFDSPQAGAADGEEDFGTEQWDGIVGRISRAHTNPYDPQDPTSGLTLHFHSIVGGPGQDGLFGIAEVDTDKFIVVGGASYLSSGVPSVGFPWFNVQAVTPVPSGPYRLGAMLTFDAGPTNSSNSLVLEGNAIPLGTALDEEENVLSTIARDVVVATHYAAGLYATYVVGTTEDANFFAALSTVATTGLDTLQGTGTSDGFLLAGWYSSGNVDFDLFGSPSIAGAYVGGEGDDGLTGVNTWNEYADHVQVCGYTQELPAGDFDILVASFHRNTATEQPASPNPTIDYMACSLLRQTQVGGDAEDRPAVMGIEEATNNNSWSGLAFTTGFGSGADSVGNPAGGGIGVDPRARANVVGRTRSNDCAPTIPVDNSAGLAYLGADDAVRSELDMMPVGVGRTDGTGSLTGTPPTNNNAVWPQMPSGGSTPTCLVPRFGRRIGETPDPLAPMLGRILVEFEGLNQTNELPSILVIRPPDVSVVVLAALNLGFPATTAFPVSIMPLVDGWVVPLVTVGIPWPVSTPNDPERTWRLPIGAPLSGPGQISVQVACWVAAIDSTNCSVQDLEWFASPALYFEY